MHLTSDHHSYIVLVGDTQFLGYGGDAVSEYPDAQIFATRAIAVKRATEFAKGRAPSRVYVYVRVVSTEEYAES